MYEIILYTSLLKGDCLKNRGKELMIFANCHFLIFILNVIEY